MSGADMSRNGVSGLTDASTDVVDHHRRDWESAIQGEGNLCCPSALSACASIIFPCVWLGGCKTLNESEGMVFLVNGKLAAIRREPGLFCLNPCCTKSIVVSTRQTSLDLPMSKIIDKKGNPINISAMLNYRIKNIVRASLEVMNVHAFVANAATAILKNVASNYSYETNDGSPSLKTHSHDIGEEMVRALQERVEVAGVRIVDMLLNELSYAPEIAAAMLQRQQAEALVEARTLIVHGAVEIARNASQQLAASGIEMNPQEKARMVSNLICVICGDSHVQPTMGM
jgi:regulator of protease activity HflC (stomatin/prohibitin superfamily)